MIRVLIADDHTLVRQGFALLLRQSPLIDVVATASDGREAVQQALATRPDIILLDVSMPNLNGLDALSQLTSELPSARVIMLSMHSVREYLDPARQLGARGYLLKDDADTDLVAAVLAVARGETAFSPAPNPSPAAPRPILTTPSPPASAKFSNSSSKATPASKSPPSSTSAKKRSMPTARK